MTAGPPAGDVSFPPVVLALAGDRSVRAVWENELGGLTFQIGTGLERWFVKWVPAGSGIDRGREAARLGWAGQWATVPRLLDQGDRSVSPRDRGVERVAHPHPTT